MELQAEHLDKILRSLPNEEPLNSEEGFLWSRIGEGISLKELLTLCPWPQDQTWNILQGLIQKKCVRWDTPSTKAKEVQNKSTKELSVSATSSSSASHRTETLPPEVREQLQMDQFEVTTRDLDLEFRKEILLRLHEAPNQNPYEILGLKRTCTENEVKIRYIELSRKFHPDRFFRKELGIYRRKLEKLFTQIQQAYQALKNPYDREVLDRKLKLKDQPAAPSTSHQKKKMDPQFEKVGKAEHYYRLGIEAQKKGDISAAANSFNLAAQLNPEKEIYAKAYKELQPLLQQNKAKDLTLKAQHFLDIGLFNDALSFAEEAVDYDPESGEAAFIAGKSIVELGLQDKLDDAFHLLRRAKTKLFNDPEPCVLLGRIYQARREKEKAKLEYEAALKRDPQNAYAKKLLSKLES